MRIAIYGGSFDPPHLGHLEAARAAMASLSPDKLLIIPANIPPHKLLSADSPTAEERFELCRLQFSSVPGAELSDIELKREGRSYSFETVRALRELYPDAELTLIVGTDMLLSFDTWFRFSYLLSECTIAALTREDGQDAAVEQKAGELREKYAARIVTVSHTPLPMSSTEIRQALSEGRGEDKLTDEVYSEIIRKRLYSAKPALEWLRKKSYAMLDEYRIAHVRGCEREAVSLAKRYGEDEYKAAEAAILHDITKKLKFKEQLILCEKYGIICDNAIIENPKLMHAVTGAAVARALFGARDEICSAIRWHTTGRPDMTRLEKIIYLADYIEPTRDFPGVDELRRLCYESLDAAMVLGLRMSIEEVRANGIEPHHASIDAYNWYKRREKEC